MPIVSSKLVVRSSRAGDSDEVEPSQRITVRETEQMMKLQDVTLKAMAKKLTWIKVTEIAEMSVRNMPRMRRRYQEFGYTRLFDQRQGMRSVLRIPVETAERVLELNREH